MVRRRVSHMRTDASTPSKHITATSIHKHPTMTKGSSIALLLVAPLLAVVVHYYLLLKNVETPPPDFGGATCFDTIASRYDLVNRVLALTHGCRMAQSHGRPRSRNILPNEFWIWQRERPMSHCYWQRVYPTQPLLGSIHPTTCWRWDAPK